MSLAISVGMGFRIVVGLIAMYLMARVGFAIIRALSAPPMPPVEAGELRKIRVNYRCDVCGVELRMTLAPDEDPPPPSHCLEQMVFVAPTFE